MGLRGVGMNPDLLAYRHILCAALGALDNREERAMIQKLLMKIDAKEAAQ